MKYGKAALSERSCREWLQKFKNGDSCQTQEEQYDGQYFEENIRFRSFIINA